MYIYINIYIYIYVCMYDKSMCVCLSEFHDKYKCSL